MHKPKALEANTGELKYPAVNGDPVSQTMWKQSAVALGALPVTATDRNTPTS